ncbi:ComF family protein [Tateyamaria pelophila]|uniref:ComF family protein n=1 Tax=Tateyamaria pelophila TaxID=328415 RepID=UPI0029588FAE|nr:phosphoribosyltransferase family protein [Tateyamaria pelophila]
MKTKRSWSQGRAALIYGGMGRKLILRLKHGDRQEIAHPAAGWMHLSTKDILTESTLIAPVPLHWMRLAKRRYNQSALIAKSLADVSGLDWCPDLLQRFRYTPSLGGKTRQERAEILTGTIKINPKRRHRIIGRSVLLIDDVLTTGATLEACAHVCRAAGAGDVCVSVLARAAKGT